MPLFLSTAEGGPPPSSPSSVPEAVQLHTGLLVDFAGRRTVDLAGRPSRGPAPAGADGGDAASGGDGPAGARMHSALTYQAVRTGGDPPGGTGDGGVPDGGGSSGGPDLGVWDCRVRPSTAGACASLVRRVVVERPGRVGPGGEGGSAAGEGSESPDEKIDADNIGTGSVPILATVDLSDPSLVQPALEAMRSAAAGIYAGACPQGDQPGRTTSLSSLERTAFGSAAMVEEAAAGGPRIALIVAAVVPPPSDVARSAQDEYVERQSRSLVLYHLSKFALETDCTLCFVSAGDGSNSEAGAPPSMSVGDLGRLVRRVALGLPPAGDHDGDAAAGLHPPGTHDGEVVRGALLRNASCEGRWDASSDDLAAALPPPDPRPTGGGGKSGGTSGPGPAGGDDAWLSKLADSVGVTPEAVATPGARRAGSAPSSGNSAAAPSARPGGRAAAGGKGTAKKRGERSRAAKAKDGKPKDEKEVMNFFDSLLKK